jgi:hypothetical protein
VISGRGVEIEFDDRAGDVPCDVARAGQKIVGMMIERVSLQETACRRDPFVRQHAPVDRDFGFSERPSLRDSRVHQCRAIGTKSLGDVHRHHLDQIVDLCRGSGGERSLEKREVLGNTIEKRRRNRDCVRRGRA